MSDRRQRAADDSGAYRERLRADCGRCFALCCVVPAFAAGSDFAVDKAAGQPCPHLAADFGCSIHDQLRPLGFPACTVYDCFGAGQQVAQVTFGGLDWRRTPGIAPQMFRVFAIVRQLHELLWYVGEALTLPAARPLYGQLALAREQTERLAAGSPETLAALDVRAHRGDVNGLLLAASELARSAARRPRADLRGADLIGKDLRGVDLRGASLRGAYLTGANLTAPT